LESDEANTLIARYTHGAGIDEPLIMERDLDASGVFETGEVSFYHADGLGSVAELTDSAGAMAQAYTYDSFGQIVDEVGTLENPYTYTGREFDGETGLYFYRARFYDDQIGRFLSEDPIGFRGGDTNLYSYVFNNPTTLVDPSGQSVSGFFLGLFACGVAVGADALGLLNFALNNNPSLRRAEGAINEAKACTPPGDPKFLEIAAAVARGDKAIQRLKTDIGKGLIPEGGKVVIQGFTVGALCGVLVGGGVAFPSP